MVITSKCYHIREGNCVSLVDKMFLNIDNDYS